MNLRPLLRRLHLFHRINFATNTKVADTIIEEIDEFVDDRGRLLIFQEKERTWLNPVRIFNLLTPAGSIRGNHAHKACWQMFQCISGQIEIEVSDGQQSIIRKLSEPRNIFQVPPGLWVRVRALENSITNVYANQAYKKNDYIEDWQEFQQFKKIR